MLTIAYSYPMRLGEPGIGMIAWHQVRELARQGVKVKLFCGTCEKAVPGITDIVETMRLAGCKIPYRLIGPRRAVRLHDLYVARQLRHSCENVKVFHGWPHGSLESMRAARVRGIPAFLERPNTHTAHAFDVVTREHERVGIPIPRSNPHCPESRRLGHEEAEYDNADYLLCPSEIVCDTFKARGVAAGRIARHQYGYDQTLFWPDSGWRSAGPLKMLFCGRCEPRKGLHYALKAWHASGARDAAKLIILGEFISGYREYLAPWLQHGSIEVQGFSRSVPDVMRDCDILVLPAVEEGSALVTYEARGSGCVVFASNVSGAMGSNGTDLVLHHPGDVDELTSQFVTALRDRQWLSRLRHASLTGVEALTWQAAGTSLLRCYERALNHDNVVAEVA